MPMHPNRKFGYSKAAAALFKPIAPNNQKATDPVAFCFLLFSSTEQKNKTIKIKTLISNPQFS
ncbi:hypothetical protein JAMGFMIE_03627 [Rheinheimera sp. MM224]|nr:hypothetical protein JAMGFMIE_03627 [Rheinheimera sp. MM224]